MRKLASIQRILNISPIPNADNIEVAKVLGWNVVVKKGEFYTGDLVVYVEIDSILPDRPEFEFLGNSRRIRTVKLRGQISQGIALPLSILPKRQYLEDQDVTEELGVTKYEPEQNLIPKQKLKYIMYPAWFPRWLISAVNKTPLRELFRRETRDKSFPQFIPKTDETRVQILQSLLTKYKGTRCYITEKVDGSSITIYLKNGKFGVCSRNINLTEKQGNSFWDTVRELQIEQKMREYFLVGNYALQGELLGEGIQGNKLKLKGQTIRFFNLFDIDEQEYFDFANFSRAIERLELDKVPVLSTEYILDDNIDALVEMAKGNSVITPNVKREGIVIRPLQEVTDSEFHCQLVRNRVSFKAINPEFLLKYND